MCESISCSESGEIRLHSWMRREAPPWARASCDGEQHVLSLFHVYSKREARADGPFWEGEVGPLRSIQFGVRKMDGSVPTDTDFMSLERFLVNREERWKRVKMKTKWEEMRLWEHAHACMHARTHTRGRETLRVRRRFSQMRISAQGPN